jgi:1-acyl-sn-glycerol-3-phosphate acyltransferase
MLLKYLRLIYALANAFFILWLTFPQATRTQKLRCIQDWSARVLAIMGVRIHTSPNSFSALTNKPQLWVANHVSWLDVLIIQSLQPSVFVAKSEVRQWPVLGAIAHACGVVFVDRSSSHSARKMVDDVTHALHHGYCVAGFPEGTSSEGRHVGVFHANIFEAAIHRGVNVQPLALRYTDVTTGALCFKAAFVGEIGLIESMHQVMRAQHIDVYLQMGKPLSPYGHTRRTLAHLSHRSVAAQLESLQA